MFNNQSKIPDQDDNITRKSNLKNITISALGKENILSFTRIHENNDDVAVGNIKENQSLLIIYY